jgi:hypothetical protein
MLNRRLAVSFVLIVVLASLNIIQDASAWGDEGHRFVNRVAAERMPEEVPPFFRSAGARLSFLGPEPDRWRDREEVFKALREGTGADHFIDIDRTEHFQALPNDRYQYADSLLKQGKAPKDIGFLPYAILEGYQKVQVLFRLWRGTRNEAERAQIEQNVIYYAGVLGHYVADGSQPLHTTIHYDGWTTSDNPDNFTREALHWRFEGEYVRASVKPEEFAPLVKTAVKLDDPFADIMKFLFESNSHVAELYRLEKTARWDQSNRNEASKRFVLSRLAAGSQMLANLWLTAWVNSASGARPPQ